MATQTQKNIAEIGLIGTQKSLNSAKEAEAKAKAYENRANAKYIQNQPYQTRRHGMGANINLFGTKTGWETYNEW